MINNTYKHPRKSSLSQLYEKLCNGLFIRKLRRSIFTVLPYMKMRSEVTNVVYMNWLVDLENAKRLVPDNVSLIDINGKTLLSILTYQHGNLRPKIFSFLKHIFPSPFQSNWRFYVSSIDNKKTQDTVFFLKNIMNNILFTINTRIFSDAMQTHLSESFFHDIDTEKIHIDIKKGVGSCPEISCLAEHAEELAIPIEMIEFFGSIDEALRYLCLQKFALSEGDDFLGLCQAEIDLPIDINKIKPLNIKDIKLEWLSSVIKDSKPFSFLIPNVEFNLLGEKFV